MWWKENLVKHQKVSKYNETDWGLPWKVALKKTKVKLNLLTDASMLLIEEEETGIRVGLWLAHKVITKTLKIMTEIKNHDILINGK